MDIGIGDTHIAKAIGVMVTVKGVKGKIAPRDQLIYTILRKIYEARYFPDRKGLNFFKWLWARTNLFQEIRIGKPYDGSGPFLSVEMPCGETIIYEKTSDVPWESVPCPCGDPNHWVIEYKEEE